MWPAPASKSACSHCSFDFAGTGQFQPEEGADPTEGEIGALHRGEEIRVEFVAPAALRSSLLKALHTAHPYEVPVYDINYCIFTNYFYKRNI